jgi:hypothetical protein
MKTKIVSLFVLALTLILSACSPFTITSSSGQGPTPVVESEPVMAYQPVQVDQVEVEVGVGSPIPVFANITGNLPDPCSQVEFVQVLQDKSNFDITLFATPDVGGPAVDGCIKDPLPFRMSIPLSVIGLPAGDYSVTVNGSRADFSLDTGTSAFSLPTVDSAFYKDDVQVDSVNVEIGRGSPLPVHAVVSLNLPNSCAQLGEIRLHREGTTFFVRLVSYVIEGEGCQADNIPFRAEIPLNIVSLPEGPYEVNVNGVTASFDPRTTPAEPGEAPLPTGWETYTSASQQCGYVIGYPPELQATDQSPDSQLFAFDLPESDAGARNFVYVSVITPEIQNAVKEGVYNHDVYNYDPAAAEILLNMQVGESKPVHPSLDVESGFTYQRQSDTTINGHAAQTYVNAQPWEFPSGTKEIRYYLSQNGCTYLIGGYVDTTGSNQPGAITEDLFHQIVATVQWMP